MSKLGSLGTTIAVILGVVAFVLFVLAVSEWYGWLSQAILDNQGAPALVVYGIIAAAGAIGADKADI